jgi:hypothetical protein
LLLVLAVISTSLDASTVTGSSFDDAASPDMMVAAAAGVVVLSARSCFLNSESTRVCLCSSGRPRNLLSVFCLSAASAGGGAPDDDDALPLPLPLLVPLLLMQACRRQRDGTADIWRREYQTRLLLIGLLLLLAKS